MTSTPSATARSFRLLTNEDRANVMRGRPVREGGAAALAFALAALCGIACADGAPARSSGPFIDPGHPGSPDWTRRGRDAGSGVFPAPATAYDRSKLVPERLGRGVVAWRDSTNTVCVGWRYLSCDPVRQSFDVYCDGVKVNDRPVSTVTQLRLPYRGRATYSVKALMPTSRPVRGGDRWTIPLANHDPSF